MIIKVLGTGCTNCNKLESNAKTAVKEAGIDAEIQKITEINDIASSGILRTPGLIINNTIKSQGKIPKVATIKQWLMEEPQEK